jgi:transposase
VVTAPSYPTAPTHRYQEPEKRGSLIGRNPVDRGEPGSKIHVLTDRRSIPLVMAIPAVGSRRGPGRRKPAKLDADMAYDSRDLRGWVRDRGIGVRIARKGIESSDRLDRHRWVIERAIAWTFNYRRLATRYERHGHNFCAFLTLGAALTCCKKLPT